MADTYDQLLKRFDPIAIARYQITAKDLETIDKYIQILQPRVSVSAWDEAIAIGGEYDTSIIIHEVTQIRALRRAGIQPLNYDIAALQHLLAENIDAHVTALYEEHLYLQEVLARKFGQRFDVATLVRANQLGGHGFQSFSRK